MPNRIPDRDKYALTDISPLYGLYETEHDIRSHFGEILTDGVLQPSRRKTWSRISTFEERYLAHSALLYSLAIGVTDTGHSELADTVLDESSPRIFSIVERTCIAHAVDVLASADVVSLVTDDKLAAFAGYVATARYAQGYRLPTRSSR